MMTPFVIAPSAKWAFTTRRVPTDSPVHIEDGLDGVSAGDLVVARVERIGSHKRLQTRQGRYSRLYAGDLIVAACGARYAIDQFEGVAELGDGTSDLLAGGGVIGRVRHRNEKTSAPTRVQVLGRLADRHKRIINLRDYGLDRSPVFDRPLVIGVLGSSMNAGKTDAAAGLIHGLAGAGWRTAGIKLTGTGSFGDIHSYLDAGASLAIDFTDAGMASTYLEPLDRIIDAFDVMVGHGADENCKAIVVELADGITQAETAKLLRLPRFVATIDGFLLCAPDPMSAQASLSWLAERNIAPMALSGLLTRSSLSVAELEGEMDLPILSRETLADPAFASALFHQARNLSPARAA
ncbi:MAG: DUF1611 domain-containing protein [Ahrensia sp.]|nr:DUF1611 domain-containing protein [Ahrensia sp.]